MSPDCGPEIGSRCSWFHLSRTVRSTCPCCVHSALFSSIAILLGGILLHQRSMDDQSSIFGRLSVVKLHTQGLWSSHDSRRFSDSFAFWLFCSFCQYFAPIGGLEVIKNFVFFFEMALYQKSQCTRSRWSLDYFSALSSCCDHLPARLLWAVFGSSYLHSALHGIARLKDSSLPLLEYRTMVLVPHEHIMQFLRTTSQSHVLLDTHRQKFHYKERPQMCHRSKLARSSNCISTCWAQPAGLN